MCCLWGLGQLLQPLPGMRLYNVDTKQMDEMPGVPSGNCVFDKYLFSFWGENISVWDVATKEFLIEWHQKDVRVVEYNLASHSFIVLTKEGLVTLSFIEDP